MPRNVTPSVQPGDRFGLWTVVATSVAYSGQTPGANPKDLCRCECGEERAVDRQNLKRGNSRSCGRYPCYLKAGGKRRGNPDWGSHGLSSDPIWSTWKNMKARCKPGHRLSASYYDRGIRVWPEWERDFMAFYGYVMGNLGPRPEGASLDRIDNDRGYEPGNIRWATPKQQNNNRRLRKDSRRPKWSQAYKRNGPAREPDPLRARPVHVPPHLAQKGWTAP